MLLFWENPKILIIELVQTIGRYGQNIIARKIPAVKQSTGRTLSTLDDITMAQFLLASCKTRILETL
jgi:hypothetical protein